MNGRRRFYALMMKESLQIIRDPSSLMIAVLLPLILLFIFGYGVSLDPQRIRIALIVENPTPLSNDLVSGFQHSHMFDVIVGNDRRPFNSMMQDGRIKGMVIIPAIFERKLVSGRQSDIQIIVDGTDPNNADFVRNYIEGTIRQWQALQSIEKGKPVNPSLQLEPRFWFNRELSSRNFLVSGSIVIILALIGTMLTSLVVAREWERGTMEAIMATPVTSFELLAGKLVPYFILGLASMTVCLLLALFLFQVPFRGSFFALYLLAGAFLVPSLGQGLLISALTKNQFLASQMALLSGFLPALILSGFIFDIYSMPQWVQYLTFIVAARYLMPSIQSVFLTGDIWPMFLQNIAIMLLIGFLFFVIAACSTRKTLS